MSEIEIAIRREIEALHEFLQDWFTGTLGNDAFAADFLRRLDPDLVLIPPGGSSLDRAAFASGVREAHGSNPGFRIAIRNVRVRRVSDAHILATYEEWQRNALASTPADNGRVATVLFARGEPLRWQHIHETWLPMPVMAAGPYDF